VNPQADSAKRTRAFNHVSHGRLCLAAERLGHIAKLAAVRWRATATPSFLDGVGTDVVSPVEGLDKEDVPER
jgi:hypothetical protein